MSAILKCGDCGSGLKHDAPFGGHRLTCPQVHGIVGALVTKESVNHPDHYGGGDNPYEVIKVLENWLTREEFIGALKFNIIKYQARASKKNGADDYKKAAWYANYLKDYIARNPS